MSNLTKDTKKSPATARKIKTRLGQAAYEHYKATGEYDADALNQYEVKPNGSTYSVEVGISLTDSVYVGPFDSLDAAQDWSDELAEIPGSLKSVGFGGVYGVDFIAPDSFSPMQHLSEDVRQHITWLNSARRAASSSRSRQRLNESDPGYQPGDRIQLIANARPTYMAGATGTIQNPAKRGTKYMVTMDEIENDSTGRFSGQSDVKVPPALIKGKIGEGQAPKIKIPSNPKFDPLDRVRVKSDSRIRPSYLPGTTATILSKRGSKYEVRVDAGQRAAERGDIWRLTPSSLEKI